jgi:hypothetical protein
MYEGGGETINELSGIPGNCNGEFKTDGQEKHRWIYDRFGHSITAFNFRKSYIEFGTCNLFDFTGDDEFSVSAWVRLTDTISGGFVARLEQSSYDGWGLRYNTTNGLSFAVWENPTYKSLYYLPPAVGLYYLVGVKHSDGTCELYVDGVLRDSDTGGNILTSKPNTKLTMGRLYYDNDSNYIDGGVDNALIYNRALSQGEISKLYNDPFCMYRKDVVNKWIGGTITPSTTGWGALLSDQRNRLVI